MMKFSDIAEVCHEANRALQRIQGDPGVPVAAPWGEFPEEERRGVIEGVQLAIEGATPEELHEEWVAGKLRDGWSYGEVKDAEAKTHPCISDYESLPEEQRMKDELFASIVTVLTSFE